MKSVLTILLICFLSFSYSQVYEIDKTYLIKNIKSEIKDKSLYERALIKLALKNIESELIIKDNHICGAILIKGMDDVIIDNKIYRKNDSTYFLMNTYKVYIYPRKNGIIIDAPASGLVLYYNKLNREEFSEMILESIKNYENSLESYYFTD